jgi:hypothetical protein
MSTRAPEPIGPRGQVRHQRVTGERQRQERADARFAEAGADQIEDQDDRHRPVREQPDEPVANSSHPSLVRPEAGRDHQAGSGLRSATWRCASRDTAAARARGVRLRRLLGRQRPAHGAEVLAQLLFVARADDDRRDRRPAASQLSAICGTVLPVSFATSSRASTTLQEIVGDLRAEGGRLRETADDRRRLVAADLSRPACPSRAGSTRACRP